MFILRNTVHFGDSSSISFRSPNLSSTSCDLNLWPPDHKVYRFMPLPSWTTCANLHHSRFIRFQNIVLTSFVTDKRTSERTDGRTDGQPQNIMPPSATLAWRKHKKEINPLIGCWALVIIVPHRIIWSWYTGRWWAGCYIWYSEEGTWRAAARPGPSSLYQM